MLRESKHIYLKILRVHHRCMLQRHLLFSISHVKSHLESMPSRFEHTKCCRNANRATEPCRSPHPGPLPSCTCQSRSEPLKCGRLKHSKTTCLFAIPCNNLCWSTKKIEQLPQSLSFAVILILSSQNGKCTSSMNRISKKLDGLGLYLHHWWWRALQTHWSWIELHLDNMFVSGRCSHAPGTHPAKLFVGQKASQKHVTSQLFVGHGAETH